MFTCYKLKSFNFGAYLGPNNYKATTQALSELVMFSMWTFCVHKSKVKTAKISKSIYEINFNWGICFIYKLLKKITISTIKLRNIYKS